MLACSEAERTETLKCASLQDNGLRYCVRFKGKKRFYEATMLLDKLNSYVMKFTTHLKNHHGSKANVKRLIKGYNPNELKEILPCSEHVAYVKNKGEEISLCLMDNKHDGKFIDINTLIFVTIHELSHIATLSIGHTKEFQNNLLFFLNQAIEANIYKPINYKTYNKQYCGMLIKHNPLFD